MHLRAAVPARITGVEDEVVVSSAAAPSVRAGKKLFEKQLSAVSSQLSVDRLDLAVGCRKSLQIKTMR